MKKILAAILTLALLLSATAFAEVTLSDDGYYAMNLFLSNFTEVGEYSTDDFWIAYVDADRSPDEALIDFAIDHAWFNKNDAFEMGEWVVDDEYANCRLPASVVKKYVPQYFMTDRSFDWDETRYEYENGYYYMQETGGRMKNGFAITTDVYSADDLGKNYYYVTFVIVGMGEEYGSDDLRMSAEDAIQYFGLVSTGRATVYATDLNDRSTYKLVSYAG